MRDDTSRPVLPQKGNALFLILIAVALFAALGFAVTRSSGGGGGDAGREKASLGVGEILAQTATIRSAIDSLMLTNRCADTALNFYAPESASAADYANNTVPDGSCDIFSATGAGVTYKFPPASAKHPSGLEYMFLGGLRISGVGTTTVNDLVAVVRVSKAACERVNALFDISGIPTATHNPIEPIGVSAFKGTYSGLTLVGGALVGKRTGCYAYSVLPSTHFFLYDVLIER